VVTPVNPDLMDQKDGCDLWRAILAGLSPEWKLLAGEPEDLSGN
jgi:hypothetical protein